MIKKLVLSIFVCALVVAALAVILAYQGFQEKTGKSDVAIVLGTTVYPDGQMAPFLKGRVDRALEEYKKGDFPLIVVSGGLGIEGHDEAQVMADYLMTNGVPSSAIIIDNAGINTQASAVHLKKIMDERHLKTVTVISQFFHIPRIKLALQCEGIDAPFSSYSRAFNIRDIYSSLREVPAYGLYWWRCGS